ncbi:hypothetical protein JTB14_036546 [Gonioctena quinquepunctata]|nr:hypothetical protein JTB14_036546 [Gonioctena quinquepunctata]
MVLKCCVCGEKRGKNHTRTLHRLPKDSERRKKWVAFLGLHSTQDNINEVGVCSSHFPKDDFIIKPSGNHYLKSTALPILRDGQSLNDFPDMQEKQLGRRTEEFMEPPLKKHCLNLRAWSVHSSQISSSTLTASGSFISFNSETDEESKQPKTKEAYSQTTFIWKEWETLKAENKQLREENSKLRKRIEELEKNEAGEDMNNFVESLKQSDKKCCTPNGAISFVSDLFEGSISDKELIKKSNLRI